MLLLHRKSADISTSATKVLLYKKEQLENISQFLSEIAAEHKKKNLKRN